MRPHLLALYCFITCMAAWSFQIVAISTSDTLEDPSARPWLIATMFTPALVALAFLLLHPPARKSVLWKLPARSLPFLLVAALVPTLTAFLIVAVFDLAGWASSGWFQFGATGVDIGGGPWSLGTGFQSWPLFVINVAATACVFSALNGLAAVGEEFGWRAFLQPKLIDRHGVGKGVVLLGLVWAFWHLPALLAGYNYPDYPLFGALVIFPLELVAASFFLAWLSIKAQSFWPAVIAHGATNSIHTGVVDNLDLAVAPIVEDLFSLSIQLVVGLACYWLLTRKREPVRELESMSTRSVS